MHAHAQLCMSGDHILSATVLATNELTNKAKEYDESFVIILLDANFNRYGISQCLWNLTRIIGVPN